MNKKDKQKREQLILDHLYLVYTIVLRIQKKLKYICDNEDLISIGTIGLINAVDKYKTEFNVKLRTYASKRILGAILDYLRSEDYLPRHNRTKVKHIEKVIQYLEHELGRETYAGEVAEKLNMSLEEYHQYLLDTQPVEKVCDSFCEDIIDSHTNLEDKKHHKEFINKVIEIISSFSERDRLIFCLYFYEDLSMNKIGEILNLQESRVSQLVRRMIMQLKIDEEIRNWFKGD